MPMWEPSLFPLQRCEVWQTSMSHMPCSSACSPQHSVVQGTPRECYGGHAPPGAAGICVAPTLCSRVQRLPGEWFYFLTVWIAAVLDMPGTEMIVPQCHAERRGAVWSNRRSQLCRSVVYLVGVHTEHHDVLVLARMAAHDARSPCYNGLFAAQDVCVVMACRHQSFSCGLGRPRG